jgi:hypothetical protein
MGVESGKSRREPQAPRRIEPGTYGNVQGGNVVFGNTGEGGMPSVERGTTQQRFTIGRINAEQVVVGDGANVEVGKDGGVSVSWQNGDRSAEQSSRAEPSRQHSSGLLFGEGITIDPESLQQSFQQQSDELRHLFFRGNSPKESR